MLPERICTVQLEPYSERFVALLDNGRLEVSKGSPAYEAGLRSGDEILAIDGYNLKSRALCDRVNLHLKVARIFRKNAGRAMTFTIRRQAAQSPNDFGTLLGQYFVMGGWRRRMRSSSSSSFVFTDQALEKIIHSGELEAEPANYCLLRIYQKGVQLYEQGQCQMCLPCGYIADVRKCLNPEYFALVRRCTNGDKEYIIFRVASLILTGRILQRFETYYGQICHCDLAADKQHRMFPDSVSTIVRTLRFTLSTNVSQKSPAGQHRPDAAEMRPPPLPPRPKRMHSAGRTAGTPSVSKKMMVDTDCGTSTVSSTSGHFYNGMKSWAKMLQPEVPSRRRTPAVSRAKSVGRAKDLEPSSQFSFELQKPKKRADAAISSDSDYATETSSMSSLGAAYERRRRGAVASATSTSTLECARADAGSDIASTKSNSPTPPEICVDSTEDLSVPGTARSLFPPSDHRSNSISGPSKGRLGIRRVSSCSRIHGLAEDAAVKVEKRGGGTRKFFAPIGKTLTDIKNKVVSVSGQQPKEETGRWSESFEALLHDKYGFHFFLEFLKTEYSQENLDFWTECEEFPKTTNRTKALAKANAIYTTYVQDGGTREVNLDSVTKATTKAALENGYPPDTFRLAQKRIEQLMEKDSFQRFLKSKQYTELVKVSPPSTTTPPQNTPKSVSRKASDESPTKSPDSFTRMAVVKAANTALAPFQCRPNSIHGAAEGAAQSAAAAK
ncbi:regulator of G-protein signaling rgs-7 [Aphelenchoides avenae]|nr:regulator of G-protein signaling rgs-7 [Aphelenchus avenae]